MNYLLRGLIMAALAACSCLVQAQAYATLKALREGTPPAKLANIASADMMKRLSRNADHERWTRDFLGGS